MSRIMSLPVQLRHQLPGLKAGHLRYAARSRVPFPATPAQIGTQNWALAQVTLGSIIFELAIERRLANAKQSRRLQFVPVEFGNSVQDRPLLQLRDGPDLGASIPVCRRGVLLG